MHPLSSAATLSHSPLDVFLLHPLPIPRWLVILLWVLPVGSRVYSIYTLLLGFSEDEDV